MTDRVNGRIAYCQDTLRNVVPRVREMGVMVVLTFSYSVALVWMSERKMIKRKDREGRVQRVCEPVRGE